MLNNKKYELSNIDPNYNWICDNDAELYKEEVPL